MYGTDRQARALALRGLQVGQPLQINDFPPEDSNYHNYQEMVDDLQALAAAHPQFVHIFSLGQSHEGRDLIGVRISNDAHDNLSEPGVFFVGQHHAREHMTVEVVLSLAHMFVESSSFLSYVIARPPTERPPQLMRSTTRPRAKLPRVAQSSQRELLPVRAADHSEAEGERGVSLAL